MEFEFEERLETFCKHIKLVLHHKYLVAKYCFKLGLYYQGIVHDLSKFSPVELSESIKYYTGHKTPIGVARKKQGYSMAWVNHHHKNKHHPHYWIDLTDQRIIPVEMPMRYFKEMVCDIIAASQVYSGKNFTWDMPLEYTIKNKVWMHPKTKKLLLKYLKLFAKNHEKAWQKLKALNNAQH